MKNKRAALAHEKRKLTLVTRRRHDRLDPSEKAVGTDVYFQNDRSEEKFVNLLSAGAVLVPVGSSRYTTYILILSG